MRAYTSLAGHILGSHPEINGYYELHHDYLQDDSLQYQVSRYLEHDTLKINSHFVFDKLLHNNYRLTDKLMSDKNNRILVSIRQPQATIKSILKLFRNKPDHAAFQNEEEVTHYYCERLDALEKFCRQCKGDYLYYDAEEWIKHPETLLPKLQGWLGLSTELSETYQQFSQTGKARAGDSSEMIRSGKISRQKHKYGEIELDQHWVNLAIKKYKDCRSALTKYSCLKADD